MDELKTCVCGAEFDDDVMVCNSCGTALTGGLQQGGRRRRSSGNSKIWIFLVAIVAVLALVITGVVVAFSGRTDVTLGRACLKSFREFSSFVEEESNVADMVGGLAGHLKDGNFTGSIELNAEGLVLESDFDYARSEKVLAGSIDCQVAEMGLDLHMNYSADKEALQIMFPEGSYDVFGFRYSDMEKNYEDSLLAKVLPKGIGGDFGSKLFEEPSGISALGERFAAFVESLKIKEQDEREILVGGKTKRCSVYQVSWDEDAMKALVKSFGLNEKPAKFGKKFAALLEKLEPECLCFVDKSGKLIGINVVTLGKQYTFLLEGKDNLWETFSLTETSLSKETVCYTGRLEKNGSVLMFSLKNEGIELCAVTYDEKDGAFAVHTNTMGTILEGNLTGNKNQSTIAFAWDVPEQGPVKIELTLKALEQKPERLAKEYRDLLSMSLIDWQRLLMSLDVDIGFM